jgi:hypothetical protein
MSIILKLMCKLRGHSQNTPIVEAWASKDGKKKSLYLCRRCLQPTGEKFYV